MKKKHIPFKKRYPHLHTLATVALVIMVWRGVWGLLDHYLFPNDLFLSYSISAVVGVVLLYLNDFSLKELGE